MKNRTAICAKLNIAEKNPGYGFSSHYVRNILRSNIFIIIPIYLKRYKKTKDDFKKFVKITLITSLPKN